MLPFLIVALVVPVTAIYFPQSDLSLRIPYSTKNENQLLPNINLLNLRILKNDSTVPKHTKYQILLPKEKIATLDLKHESILLHTLPKNGSATTIVVQAIDEENGSEAILEIKILPYAVKNDKINCSDYLEDICFWNATKLKIYENQPATMLGTLGSGVYKSICPQFQISDYVLLNETSPFYIKGNQIYSNDSLDRDTLNPPKGVGARVNVNVRCVIWDEATGKQYTNEKMINIDVLDENDNPPIPQFKKDVVVHLKDFTQGDRLDEKNLIITDADDTITNSYSIRILDDPFNVLNLTFDIFPLVDHPKIKNIPHSTVIVARLYSRSTLFPKSPYRVILQAKDESLLPGFGNNTVNVTLTFIGPQRHTTTTQASVPLKEQQIAYPVSVEIPRVASVYYRVAQPLQARVGSEVTFELRNQTRAFGITSTGGIVYVAEPAALRPFAGSVISLKIEWRTPDDRLHSSILRTNVTDSTKTACKQFEDHSCANAKTAAECKSLCGIASGNSNSNDAGCAWRANKANVSTMTPKYATCSPDLAFCPNSICDELEHLNPRICPQDCVTEAEILFGEVDKDGRGIGSGPGVCWCSDEDKRCTCGASFIREPPSIGSLNTREPRNKEHRLGGKSTSSVWKASSSTCGSSCLIGIVVASLFVLIIIIGSLILWRYRIVHKGHTRRGCIHRGSDCTTNGLQGILPMDYADRGDGLLIGLESLTPAANFLVPKKSPPDPKWEFPRSRLTIEQILGEGEFGRVLRAKAQDIAGTIGDMTVAVKTLKEDASTSELADLLSEYQLLKEAQHPNVIRLLGACTTAGGPIYLIIEFAEFGSLRNYLRRSRHLESEGRVPCSTLLLSSSPNTLKELQQSIDPAVNYTITPRDILSFAWQISKGMAYLADIKLVHRDLAARNVLVAAGKVCKISDFGLTRDVYEDDAYLKRSKGRVPVKWMAPESLADHVYTSKSDVWSFGVLLWELVTLGASPYPGIDVHNLYNLLKSGYRMEKPTNCSYQLYKLMSSCWNEEPGMRPSFKELTCLWERMLEDSIEYLDLNPRTVHNQAYFASLHTLESPCSSTDSKEGPISHVHINLKNNPNINEVNYLNKPSFEPITKADKVDKLEELWHEPLGSELPMSKENSATSSSSRSGYVNDPVKPVVQESHYETPTKRRNIVAENELDRASTSGGRPQSYVDMHQPSGSGAIKETENLLMSFTGNGRAVMNDFGP